MEKSTNISPPMTVANSLSTVSDQLPLSAGVSSAAKWRLQNPEKVKAYSKYYSEKYASEISEGHKKRYYSDVLASRKKQNEYRAKNRQKYLEWSRQYYKNHRSQYLASAKQWKAKNPDKIRAYCVKNKKKIHQQQKARYAKNPGKYHAVWHKRRSRILSTVVRPELIEKFICLIRSKKRVKCYYCPRVLSGKKVHIEHIIPLDVGGKHEIGNLCAACPSCNCSKHRKLLTQWQPKDQKVLPL